MGISSRQDSIDRLYFRPLKTGKIIRNANVVKVSGITLVQDSDGKLYCDKFNKASYGFGNWPWLSAILRVLVKLNVIDQTTYHAHMKEAKEISEATERKYTSEQIVKLKKNGFKLTKEMEQFVKDNPPPHNGFI